jgi:hypothetical protein
LGSGKREKGIGKWEKELGVSRWANEISIFTPSKITSMPKDNGEFCYWA